MPRITQTPSSASPVARLALLLVFAAAGCADGLVAPRDSESDATYAPKSDVPLTVAGSGVLVDQRFAPDFGPPLFGKSTFDGRCSIPADYVVAFAIEGEGTHAGELTVELSHCGLIDFVLGAATDVDGILVLSAANGDELHGTYTCDPIPGPTFGCSVEFGGGTGRFASATGEATMSGTTHRPTATIPSFAIEGRLMYDASDTSA